MAQLIDHRLDQRSPRRLPDVDDRGDDVSHPRRLPEWRQVGQPHAVGKPIEHLARDLERQACLATPAGAGERQQPRGGQQPLELSHLPLTTNEAGELRRQIVGPSFG